uniref:Uncharacterized protein n=1 Tax=Arion vulgaris TaxID=1028688 RepID=A0A0B7BCS7_9EUPU
MKSTPITALEAITGLQPMKDRIDRKVTQLAEKFKRRNSHPMYDRMNGLEKGRLKRTNFAKSVKALIQDDPVLAKCKPKLIPATVKNRLGDHDAKLRESIPGIQKKGQQANCESREVTEEFIATEYPGRAWTHVTDRQRT